MENPTVVGLFGDLAVTLNGLPSGAAIVVSVTAPKMPGKLNPHP